MADTRSAILKSKKVAGKLHRELGIKKHIEIEGGQVDVFNAILKVGIPFIFRPLDKLLGAFYAYPNSGIMVTTERNLNIQRFTAAHELGHFVLKHHSSLDDERVFARSMVEYKNDSDPQEFEANFFASEFILPDWLFVWHLDCQGWSAMSMENPEFVYQLSLRIGASYEATCRSLMRPGIEIADKNTVNTLLKTQPKTIKKNLLGDYVPQDWRRDVWLLTEKDEGSIIKGSRSDLFVLKLNEHSGAGFVWTFDEINKEKFIIVQDERENLADENIIGGHITRLITAYSEPPHKGQIVLKEKRPWIADDSTSSFFRVDYDFSGPADRGILQASRENQPRSAE